MSAGLILRTLFLSLAYKISVEAKASTLWRYYA